MSFAYLGPPGTHTEEALLSLSEAHDADVVPLSTIPEVIAAVARGEVAAGMVPIENSIEGSVNLTLDTLAFGGDPVQIAYEVVRPIRHALLARPGAALQRITDVISHPQATAQCREWLAANLPDARVHAANSTAEAAREVAGRDKPWAAIAAAIAAEIYGLVVVEPDIEDHPDNSSRFVLLRRERPPPTGADKTSVVCFIEQDRPGSLLAILHEFSDRNINLTKLVSRPTKERLGEYCFFIDMEGHADEPPVSYAIESLRTKIMEVKVLGSYPRA